MPQNTTATFDTYNVNLSKKPVFIVEFDGISSLKFTSNEFSGITTTYKKWLKMDASVKLFDADPIQGRTGFGDYEFTILDIDNNITSMIINNVMDSRGITVKYGYQELGLSDFVTLPKGFVVNIQSIDNLTAYKFIAQVSFYKLYGMLFEPLPEARIFGANLDAGATGVGFEDASIFWDPIKDWSGPGKKFFIMIENEILSYNTINTSVNRLQGLIRGRFGTSDVIHAQGEKVKQIVVFGDGPQENFGENLIRMMTTTASGNNGNYDVGISNFGLGISASYVDERGIPKEALKSHVQDLDKFVFIATEPQRSPDFLEKILKMAGPAFLTTTTDGKITIKILEPIYDDNAASLGINQNNIIGLPKIEIRERDVINRIKLSYGNRRQEKDSRNYKLQESISALGQRDFFSLDYENVSTLDNNVRKRLIRRVFWLHGGRPVDYEFDAFYSQSILTVGDVVTFTHNKIPNFVDGTRGITAQNTIVLAKDIELLARPKFRIRSWDPFNSLTFILSNSSKALERTVLVQYSPDSANINNAKDGYSFATGQAQHWGFKLTCTPPGSANDSITYAYFGIHASNQSGAGPTYLDFANCTFRLPYNPSWTGDFIFRTILSANNITTPDVVKVQWFKNGATAVNQLTQVVLNELRAVNPNAVPTLV